MAENPQYSDTITIEGGIGSISSNATEGQISVTLKGNTYTNFIKNGNFANGINKWATQDNSSVLSASNNTLIVTGTGNINIVSCIQGFYGNILQAGHKYYVRARVRVTNSNCTKITLDFRSSSIQEVASKFSPAQNQWYTLSGIITALGTFSTPYIRVICTYPDAATAAGKVTEVQEVIAIDLTVHGLDSLTVDQCNQRFAHWFDGVKSTISAMRIRSVSSDETQQSEIYIPNIGELRSLPNGVKDEFNIVEGRYTKRISDPISISDTMYASLDTTSFANVDIVKTVIFSDALAGTTGKDGMTRYYNKDNVELTEVAQADIDNPASVGKYYWHTDKTLWIIVAKGAYADIAAARTGLGSTQLIYQLATPVVTEYPPQSLIGYPSGMIYWEPVVKGTAIYNNGIAIENASIPIKSMRKVYKLDLDGKSKIEVSVSNVTVAADGLSFTIANAQNGEIYEYEYEYDTALSTIPTIETVLNMNLKAVVNNTSKGLADLNKYVLELNDFTVATLLNHEARLTLLGV
nr:carbohydrate binding domain-containing protein [Caldicoprobacter algeriensis]